MSYNASPFVMFRTRPFWVPSKNKTTLSFGSLPGAVTVCSLTSVIVQTCKGLTSSFLRYSPSLYARYDFMFQFQFVFRFQFVFVPGSSTSPSCSSWFCRFCRRKLSKLGKGCVLIGERETVQAPLSRAWISLVWSSVALETVRSHAYPDHFVTDILGASPALLVNGNVAFTRDLLVIESAGLKPSWKRLRNGLSRRRSTRISRWEGRP